MPFNLRETIGGLHHQWLKWQRFLLKRPADYYLSRLSIAQPLVFSKKTHDGKVYCHICGYALLRMESAGGFLVEACSAADGTLVTGNQFACWLEHLEQNCAASCRGQLPATACQGQEPDHILHVR